MKKVILIGKNERLTAIVALVTCAGLWSLGGLLIKLVNLNPVAIAGVRSLVAGIIIMMLTGKPKFSFSPMQIGAAVTYTGTVMLFVIANKMTTSANAILLQYTAPIYAAILGWIFLREKVSLIDWGAILFVLAGMGLFFMGDITGGNMLGNILAIISGVTFAAQAIFLKLQKGVNAASSIVLGNFLTFIISIPFLFQKVPTVTDVTALIVMGTFQLGLAYTLYSFAVTRLSALETILLPVIEPILNPVWVFMFIGEIPGRWTLIGGLIVITSVTVRCYLASKKQSTIKLQSEIQI